MDEDNMLELREFCKFMAVNIFSCKHVQLLYSPTVQILSLIHI